jgi:hypothetical protein
MNDSDVPLLPSSDRPAVIDSVVNLFTTLQEEGQLVLKFSDMNSQYLIENVLQTIMTMHATSLLRQGSAMDFKIPDFLEVAGDRNLMTIIDDHMINNVSISPEISQTSRQLKVLLGCDGSLMSDYFLRLALRVIAAQTKSVHSPSVQFENILIKVPDGGLLTTAQAKRTMGRDSGIDMSIIFTFPLALREIRIRHFLMFHYSEVRYETN